MGHSRYPDLDAAKFRRQLENYRSGSPDPQIGQDMVEGAIDYRAAKILDEGDSWEALVECLASLPKARSAIREIYEYVRHRPELGVSTSEETLVECLEEVATKMAEDELLHGPAYMASPEDRIRCDVKLIVGDAMRVTEQGKWHVFVDYSGNITLLTVRVYPADTDYEERQAPIYRRLVQLNQPDTEMRLYELHEELRRYLD